MRTIIDLLVVALLVQTSCAEEVEPDPQEHLYGLYNMNITYADFNWGIGYEKNTIATIGRIEKFSGYDGHMENLDSKIGIVLDTTDVTMFTGVSCIPSSLNSNDSLLYRYISYYHPTLIREGKLNYPELECAPEFPVSSFEGIANMDSIQFRAVVADEIGGVEYEVVGRKIK